MCLGWGLGILTVLYFEGELRVGNRGFERKDVLDIRLFVCFCEFVCIVVVKQGGIVAWTLLEYIMVLEV